MCSSLDVCMANYVDGRKISRKTLEHLRLKAVDLRKKKWKVCDIADVCGVHQGSVSRWLTKERREGLDALKERKAPGANPKLSDEDISLLFSALEQPATAFGFETDLWDCKRVQIVIKRQLHKNMHVSNVWRMLNKMAFSPQKPERRAKEQDGVAVKKWLKNTWPAIKKHARRWQAIIYFQDECGVSLIPSVGRTWAPIGQTPLLRTTGKKGGICVTSVISVGGKLLFRIEKGRIKGPDHIDFLKQVLHHHHKRKIIIIEDQARPHTAKVVKEFATANKKRLAIYYLPTYSAELNPDEKTWRHLKKHKLKAHTATTITELKDVVIAKMRSIQRKPSTVRSFFYGTYVT